MITSILSSASRQGAHSSAAVEIPSSARQARFIINISALDYLDASKWLHVHLYVGPRPTGPFRHLCGFSRVGGTFTDRLGTLNPPPSITFTPLNDLTSIRGQHVVARAYVNVPAPRIAGSLLRDDTPENETVEYVGPAMTIGIDADIT